MSRSKSSTYTNPNPGDKRTINQRIAQFAIPARGSIVLLDDLACASAQALVDAHGPAVRTRIRLSLS
jgi:hypothetical protein